MNEIQSAVLALLPPKKKTTPSGWISFNAVCCHHRGESQDTRQRGGLLTDSVGGFQYNCFNCNFKTGWTQGKLLSSNLKQLFRWLGMGDTDIGRLGLIALKYQENSGPSTKQLNFELEEKSLPQDCGLIDNWIAQGVQEPDLLDVCEYLVAKRKMGWDWYPWMWSPVKGYRDRVIVPFYHNSKVVGYTCRKISEGKPKYISEQQPGYVFNLDRQNYDRQFVIVTEGPFDAIAIDGVAVMHNEINDTQSARIRALGKEVIVVPDRDRAGAKLIKAALDNDWSISMPPWAEDIKDVADAVSRYGRLYCLTTILHYRESNKIKIQLQKKKLESQK